MSNFDLKSNTKLAYLKSEKEKRKIEIFDINIKDLTYFYYKK